MKTDSNLTENHEGGNGGILTTQRQSSKHLMASNESLYNAFTMTIKLALFSERDLEGKPALFVMLSSFPDGESPTGLGAQSRTFHFTAHLVEALAPTELQPGFLQEIAEELEQGKGHLLEISNEQAASLGMLPHRDGYQWVRITTRKIETGDGSFRYCESYQVGDRTVDGNVLEETLELLEARVRRFVAIDWTAVDAELELQEASSTMLNLPDETVRYIFDGDV